MIAGQNPCLYSYAETPCEIDLNSEGKAGSAAGSPPAAAGVAFAVGALEEVLRLMCCAGTFRSFGQKSTNLTRPSLVFENLVHSCHATYAHCGHPIPDSLALQGMQ